MKMEEKRLLILYASQTGNAQDAAERVGREAHRKGCRAMVLSVDEYDVRFLPKEEMVIFLVSTTGQGDTPDTMKMFWKSLLMKNLGQTWLKGMHYAVFGLGDSGYQKFNVVAKKLDKRLADLGASPIIERGLGDDQHRSGYEAALDPWLSLLWERLKEKFLYMFQNDELPSNTRSTDFEHPKYKIVYHDLIDTDFTQKTCLNDKSEIQNVWIERGRACGMVEAADSFYKPKSVTNSSHEPLYFGQMIKNERMTPKDSDRDVRHIEFDIDNSNVEYEPGDVLELMPCQSPKEVDAFIERCGLNADAYITVEVADIPSISEDMYLKSITNKKPVKLRTLVESTMDVASASPRRYFFEVMSHFATADHERERLEYFSSPEGRDDLYEYNQKEHRTVNEVLQDFPSVHLSFEWLLQLVPRLRKRMFSISSSLLTHPNQVHITVAVVSWLTPCKRQRHGLCSSWLAHLDPQKNDVILPIWFRRGALKFPPLSVPLVLVGPGTGCAPFRAFIEHRASLSRKESVAPILFFFGCRNRDKDFLYKDFWLSHSKSGGLLSVESGGGFFVAFSRDQLEKVYVQHKIKSEASKVWEFLKSGAWVYVSGSATKMPADVSAALEEVVANQGGFQKDVASRWLRQLERVGRYHVEAWS